MNQDIFTPRNYYEALPVAFVSNDPIGQVDLLGLRGVPTVPGNPPSTPMQPPNSGGIGAALDLLSQTATINSGAISNANKNNYIRAALDQCRDAAAGEDCGPFRICCCCEVRVWGSDYVGGGSLLWTGSSGTFHKKRCKDVNVFPGSYMTDLPPTRLPVEDVELTTGW